AEDSTQADRDPKEPESSLNPRPDGQAVPDSEHPQDSEPSASAPARKEEEVPLVEQEDTAMPKQTTEEEAEKDTLQEPVEIPLDDTDTGSDTDSDTKSKTNDNNNLNVVEQSDNNNAAVEAYDDDFQDESDHDKRGKRSDKDSSSSSSSRSRGASVSSKSSRSSSIGRERVEYQVIIATFDEIGSGTEAPAFIELIGSSATSKKFPLKQYDGATTFERGATNEFTVKAREDLGELTAVRLHLEDGGIGSSWRPESITVSRGDQQWTFPAGRWIEKNECETFTVEDIAGENDDEVYVVTIQTSSQAMAGTDARVFATLVGEDRRSNRVQLKNDRIDCFERGQTDQFKARFGSNLGEIHSIELETEGGGLTSGWLPETITVANGGREWRFQTGRWIEKNSIETLPVVKDATGEDDSDAVDANERRFTVTVKTGDRMGADTDGRATIQLAGTEATSEQISLEEFRQNKDGRLYRRGQADKFNIQADEQLGDLKTIELYIEGGISTDWYVERVIAEQNDKRWEFPFERWIQKERPERCAAVAALPDRADDDLTRQRRASGSSRSDRSDDEEVVNFKIEGSPEHAAPDQQQKSAAAGVTEVPVDDAPDVEDSRNTQSTLVRKEEKRRRVSGSDRGSSGEDSDADRKKKGHIQTRISSFSEESDSGSEDERDQEPATLQIRPSSDEEDESEEEENQRWKEMEASRKREEEDRKREEEDRKREEEDRKREEEAAAAAQRREEERRQEEEERQRKQQQMLEDQLDRMRQEQQAIKEKGLCDYKIRFVTDSTEDAGTHATVSIVLCGEQGDSDVRTFKNEQGRKFQSGSTSEFSISIPDLGAINKIRIFTDVQYEQDRWLLSRVEVEDQQRGVTRSFPCGKWFTRDCDSHILLAPPTDDEVSQHEESRPSSARQAVPTLAAPPTAATTTTTGATTTSTGDAGSFGKPSTAASGTTATAQSSDTASTDESEQSDDDVSSTAEESSEADSDSSDSESDTETAGEDDEAAESVPRQNRMRSGSVQPDDIQPPETRIGKVRDLFKDNGVSVYDTKLSDEQFELFLKELNQREKAEKMESVSVRNCQLTDSQAIRMLEALAGYDKLNYLNLTCNSISSRTASVIAERLS
uniref:PLAT domain-containing protein n=1 Tax=Macrostomum lignano TaxID=282301 RepID=A0A1I8JD35_9PLAT